MRQNDVDATSSRRTDVNTSFYAMRPLGGGCHLDAKTGTRRIIVKPKVIILLKYFF